MLKYVELYFTDIIKGKKRGPLAFFFRSLLTLASWGYRAGVSLRNRAFDGGWIRRYFPPVPVVVSIGNIVSGGTGKTPLTLLFAKEFYSDYQLAILSRGYRSKAERSKQPVFLSVGKGPDHPASYCGDEPFLIAQQFPKTFVVVGRDRKKSSEMAAKQGAQLMILDDGMQHRQLARDYEVVVLDSNDPFGHGHFLPRGFLRESAHSLKRADIIILNHVERQERFDFMVKELEKYTTAPVVGTRLEPEGIVDFSGEAIQSIEGKQVGIFCGIARPESFRKTVEGLGAHVIAHYFKPDHVGMNDRELSTFADTCKSLGAECVICTEKDRVRFVKDPELSLPIVWVKVQMSIVAGQEVWNQLIWQVKSNLTHKM